MTVIIQIVISIVAVYLIFSIIVYVVMEWIASLLQLRGKTLKNAIAKLFTGGTDSRIATEIYQHPQVRSLKNGANKLPSYIPASNFAITLIDLVRRNDLKGTDPAATDPRKEIYQSFRRGLHEWKMKGNNPNDSFLDSIADQSGDLESLSSEIEKWYNDYMDRVTGWYKRNTKIFVLVIAIAVTIGFNVDSLRIIKTVSRDPVTRQRLNQLADQLIVDSTVNKIVVQQQKNSDYFEDYVNDDSFRGKDSADNIALRDSLIVADNQARVDDLKKMTGMVDEWDLPVGWNEKPNNWGYLILGWIITVVALSAGAPFWFDMLKRLVNVRNTGIKPISSSNN